MRAAGMLSMSNIARKWAIERRTNSVHTNQTLKHLRATRA